MIAWTLLVLLGASEIALERLPAANSPFGFSPDSTPLVVESSGEVSLDGHPAGITRAEQPVVPELLSQLWRTRRGRGPVLLEAPGDLRARRIAPVLQSLQLGTEADLHVAARSAEGEPVVLALATHAPQRRLEVGPTVPPMVLHHTSAGLWLGREPQKGIFLPGAELDPRFLHNLLARDRQHLPRATALGLAFDETTTWAEVVELAEIGLQAGYRTFNLTIPAPPHRDPSVDLQGATGTVEVPKKVTMSQEGSFHLEIGQKAKEIPLREVRRFEASCHHGGCDVVLVTREGKAFLVDRTLNPMTGVDPDTPTLLGRSLVDTTRPSLRSEPAPTFEGIWDEAPPGSLARNVPESWPVGATDEVPQTHLARADLDAQVVEAFPALQACYERVLATRPGARGRLDIRYLVGPGGVVLLTDVVKSDLREPAIESCVQEVFSRLRFADPGPGQVLDGTRTLLFEGG